MKIARVVFSILFMLAISGCIKVDQTLTINKDGSGQFDMSYSMRESTIKQMESMAKMQAAQGGEDADSGSDFEFNEDSLREQLTELEDEGIKIISIDSETADGWKTMKVKLGFEDLDALVKTEMMQDNNFSIKKNSDGNYVLIQKTGEDAVDEEEMAPEMMAQMAPMFAGMRIVQRIKVPGKVIRSNATELKGDTAAWIYDIDKDPSVLNKLKSLNMEIEFEGAGLDLKEI